MTRLAIALLAICALTRIAHAADPLPVRITVIADLDDGIHNARPGRGGVDATRMAVADFGGAVLGRPVVIDALNDHKMIHDLYVVRVLPSAQLTDSHGWYRVLQTVPAKTAFPAGTQCRMSP